MNIDQKDIEQYLSELKEAVEQDNYRLDRNAKRQDNINLFLDYVIDETKAKEIILSLNAMDFSEILQNEHKGFEHEKLYVFGKDVTLLERNGTEEKTVSLYIKFNKLENCFVIYVQYFILCRAYDWFFDFFHHQHNSMIAFGQYPIIKSGRKISRRRLSPYSVGIIRFGLILLSCCTSRSAAF